MPDAPSASSQRLRNAKADRHKYEKALHSLNYQGLQRLCCI